MNAIAPFKCLLACVTATTMCAMMTLARRRGRIVRRLLHGEAASIHGRGA